jgi:hypothetical protein
MGWQVQLVGDPADLRMLADALCDPPVTVSEENGEFLLRCAHFDGLTDAHDVGARAGEIVTALSGLSRLELGSDRRIRVGSVMMVSPDGRRHTYLLPEPGELRLRGLPIGIEIRRADGAVETHRPGDPVRELIPMATKDPTAAKALRLRDVDRLGWVELYRLYEVIEADAGGPPNIIQRGWARGGELRRFTHTANSVSAAGDEARHGRERTQPPGDPMTLSEAKELVDRILKGWLRTKAEAG